MCDAAGDRQPDELESFTAGRNVLLPNSPGMHVEGSSRLRDPAPHIRQTQDQPGPVEGEKVSLAPDAADRQFLAAPSLAEVGVTSLEAWEHQLSDSVSETVVGDARDTGLEDNSVDLVVTSPPYWQKRDYGHPDQIGQEPTPQAYVESMMECLDEWKRVLRPTGSVFLNVGDTYYNRSLMGIPGLLEFDAVQRGWLIRNRIIWTKDGGMPEPAQNRLANRHEYIIHLTLRPNYYYDLVGYSEYMGNGANPGDVWKIAPERNMGAHLAPYPQELVRRAVMLGCPPQTCATCRKPRTRVFERTRELDPERPQAKRAMELADAAGLTDSHIRAIQATGVSDVGKATKFQSGTGRNSANVQRLAAEAKAALGGYFREFTFARKETVGWTDCGHGTPARGVVLDPFMGTGTTLKTATAMDRDAIGVDLMPLMQETEVPAKPGKAKGPATRSGR